MVVLSPSTGKCEATISLWPIKKFFCPPSPPLHSQSITDKNYLISHIITTFKSENGKNLEEKANYQAIHLAEGKYCLIKTF
jgi:hypothetical protein